MRPTGMHESFVSYDPDRGRVLIFGPGGFIDLPMSLEDARMLVSVLELRLEIRGQPGSLAG